jgi:hypothetical protein
MLLPGAVLRWARARCLRVAAQFALQPFPLPALRQTLLQKHQGKIQMLPNFFNGEQRPA